VAKKYLHPADVAEDIVADHSHAKPPESKALAPPPSAGGLGGRVLLRRVREKIPPPTPSFARRGRRHIRMGT
jgi:hypothetical protein